VVGVSLLASRVAACGGNCSVAAANNALVRRNVSTLTQAVTDDAARPRSSSQRVRHVRATLRCGRVNVLEVRLLVESLVNVSDI
jgi:hypothetical protein